MPPPPTARAMSNPSPPRRRRFTDLLPKYESNPGLFAQVTLVQAMGPILTNVQDKIFLPARADGKPRELRLMLNREPPEPKTAPCESVN
jgi:hypothetical protein